MPQSRVQKSRASSRAANKIGLLTGGGDCPGLNAAIRAVVHRSLAKGWQPLGFHNGWAGVLNRDFEVMDRDSVAGILDKGGTMLGTSRTDPRKAKDSYKKVEAVFKDLGLHALIPIGGDDTLSVANQLAKDGHPVVGVPKTMDNDVTGTDFCIGFDSAVTRGTEAIDWIHTTASSHGRIIVVEVMGRDAGWVATYCGLAGAADYVFIPELPTKLADAVKLLEKRRAEGKRYGVVVVSEGASIQGLDEEGGRVDAKDQFGHLVLGTRDLGRRLADAIERETGFETRSVVLGHVQRGGPPTVADRVLGSRLGVAAVDMVARRRWGHMPALQGGKIIEVALEVAVGTNRKVDLDIYEVAKVFF